MSRAVRTLVVLGIMGFLLASPFGADALVDDFEDEFWLPFTHFHLGDRASAGYSSAFARSGTRSYHVEIGGWTVRDFGAAYGYATYATDKAPITEVHVSLLYDRLQDLAASSRDAFAAGVGFDLLDADYRSLGRFRYFTAYRASAKGGLCGPTSNDVVLPGPDSLGIWTDLRRSPAADFPSARWQSADFVKISVGFLCAAGLAGASYSMYVDDFLLDTGARDSDGDGLGDLEEEARIYLARITSPPGPTEIGPMSSTTIEVHTPPGAGVFTSAAVGLEIHHPRPDDLSVELIVTGQGGQRTQLLWDPGFHTRGVAILSPSDGAAVRGTVEVRGKAWRPNPIIQFHVDGSWVGGAEGDSSGAFTASWNSDRWTEGPHRLLVSAQAREGDELVSRTSAEITVVIDRSPPDLSLVRPQEGDKLSGLAVIEAGAFDAQGPATVELRVDGSLVDVREEDPYTFVYDTLDLNNGAHTFEVRALDAAGNEATRSVTAKVKNKGTATPPRCSPRCNLRGVTTTSDLPPLAADARGRSLFLANGDLLEVFEAFQVPWRSGVDRTETSVHLTLDATRPRRLPETDGLLGSGLAPADLTGVRTWQIVVRDHGAAGGLVTGASVSLAFRTSPGLYDTDGDGISDGTEHSTTGTVPTLPDLDGDFLTDGEELAWRLMTFVIDGVVFDRVIRTDPFDFDTDEDGLPDGLELVPGEGRNPTDPLERDTDHDGLLDGAERLVHRSDPTLTDSDGDTLTDYQEVTPLDIGLEIDGIPVDRTVATSPIAADTDGDGLRDDEEWDGLSRYGFLTDPADPDTDRDGLSDLDEVAGLNRRPTNPVVSDTDGDGIIDGLDLSPTELWSLPWKTTFEPGTVRFTQRFHALGVHGLSASIWTYRIDDGSCNFLSDHTSEATRSSDESVENVIATVNTVLVGGGETNFTATRAEDFGQESWGTAPSSYGACDFWNPRQYRFDYIHDSHAFDVDFVNTAEVAIRDDAGDLFYHATLPIPIQLSKPQGIVLQFSIDPIADRGSETVVPAIVYSLVRGTDFQATAPFYRNIAVGAAFDDHAYDFHLRIPKDVATEENVTVVNGEPAATLFLMPMWLTSGALGVSRSALNTTQVTVGAAISRVHESAELVVARLSTDMEALEAALPTSTDGLSTGYQTFGAFSVYVHRIGDAFDPGAPETVDAVYLVGESPEELASFQETIVWNPPKEWVRKSKDGFGLAIDIFKIIRRGISLTSQITAAILFPLVNTPSGREQMTFGRSVFIVDKLVDIETGEPHYVISRTTMTTVKIRISAVRTNTIEVPLYSRGEIVDNLDDSKLLTSVKYSHLKSALRGAAIGATIAIFGSQAVLAFRDGDLVKGTFYAGAGTTAVLGIVKADVPLFEDLFATTRSLRGKAIKLGTVAAIGVGGILASYELFLASHADDSITKLSHYEGASGVMADTLISVVPLYGTAAMLGWQLGLTIAVTASALLGTLPDPLALRIVSSPGSTIVFLFEYVFGTEIPSEVAEDALVSLLNLLAEAARFSNAMNPPTPTILLVP